jgi:hypothetical protein
VSFVEIILHRRGFDMSFWLLPGTAPEIKADLSAVKVVVLPTNVNLFSLFHLETSVTKQQLQTQLTLHARSGAHWRPAMVATWLRDRSFSPFAAGAQNLDIAA